MSKQVFRLVHQEARQRAARAAQEAPQGYLVTIQEPRRDLQINAALHAKLTEIAQSMEWAGKKWDVETWKRLLTAAWGRATGEPLLMLPALDGAGVDVVFRRTSDLTQAECRELLAFIDAWQHGGAA